ncbi:MAG: HAMP domain-containing sensor histidine kinase [Lachnospiraceae bacterium]|nr:HAMP domain-containing sensor histidine kinase [Lachnospiraceae bacterium]
MRKVNKPVSIYFQLLKLLTVSVLFSSLLFFGLYYVGNSIVDYYYESSGYEEGKDQKYIDKLQKYIDKHQLFSRDVAALNTWVESQKIIQVSIYSNNILVFDSDYPEAQIWKVQIAEGGYEWEDFYTVQFQDGEADVLLDGYYSYQLYNYVLIIDLMISFLSFLTFVLLGIRKKMKYISKLSNEVEILEGGSLEHEITVKGNDELTFLAKGIDSMRKSFISMIKRENDIVSENQRIITEMSHDIRTPVTSIILYSEIIKKGKYKDELQLEEYINKINQKAHRMKQLTEHLFEYSLVSANKRISLEEPESYEVLLYDLFSETVSYLEQQGFHVELQILWGHQKIRMNSEYMSRIMDNITSNIIKYANSQKKVVLRTMLHGNKIAIAFKNGKKEKIESIESTQIGLQNIHNMMKKMNGECIVEQTKESFCVTLYFPIS